MEVLKDALTVNKKAFENTLKSIKNVPIIALVLIVYTILQALFNLLISPLNILANGMIAGIIRYVFNILLLSNLLGILFSVVNYNRITKNDLTSCSIMSNLPAHASMATLGCEAAGTKLPED